MIGQLTEGVIGLGPDFSDFCSGCRHQGEGMGRKDSLKRVFFGKAIFPNKRKGPDGSRLES